jgi:hypothetical protein
MLLSRKSQLITAILIAANAAGAQTVPLPATDNMIWSVACTTTGSIIVDDGQPTGPCNGTFTSAVRLTPDQGGWIAWPVGYSFWISKTATGTLWPDAPNGNPHYLYTFRTYLDMTSINSNTMSISLSAFYFENYWVGWSVNGSALSALGVTPPQNVGNWQTPFTLNVTSGDFNANSTNNYFDIVIAGNGVSDAMLAVGSMSVVAPSIVTTTPEPASIAMVASGLGLIGLILRRRRKA